MELNPSLVAVLGLVVFVLGLIAKRYGLHLEDKRLLWAIVGISVVGGVVQVIVSAQTSPLPALPTEPAQIAFVWLPQIVAWVVASAAAVFAASQAIYALIVKGLAPPPIK